MVTKGNSSQGLLYVMVRSGQPHGPMLLTKSKYHHTFDQGCELFLPCLLLGQRVVDGPGESLLIHRDMGMFPVMVLWVGSCPWLLCPFGSSVLCWVFLLTIFVIPSKFATQSAPSQCSGDCFRNLGNEINAVQDRRSTASRSPSQVPRNQSASMCCYNNIALSF